MTTRPELTLTSGVREIAEAVAGGEISPIEVLEAVFARIEATDEKIHAWSYLDLEMARQQAEALTVEAKAGRLRGSLHGVPVAVKDEFHVKGMPTAPRGENAGIEPEDATVVRKLREAGRSSWARLTCPWAARTRLPATRGIWNTHPVAPAAVPAPRSRRGQLYASPYSASPR